MSWLPNGFINNTRHELMPTDLQEKYYQQYGDAIEKFSSNLNGIVVGSLTQVAGAGAFSMRWALLYLAAFPDAQLAHKFEFSIPEGKQVNLKAISGVFLVPEEVEIKAKSRF
ncbi:hypothetical protein [Pseudoalteromonas sp. Of7M-16]|uniref:hypothetical protein n=1 Tax=Pseudoalteromonas sp. Of7M-16 TaxID=2917756 RepID=UPI001EF40874|nr:hypothetical protein [Pseudoalteromonas sp. Of7M-16]MCG7547818.1 hypothetical protein [Pseudoalteromonas sp. Of7M-16]